MSKTNRILAIIFFCLIAIVCKNFYNIVKPLPVPKLDLNANWGPDEEQRRSNSKGPSVSRINLRQWMINDLKGQLSRNLTLTPPLEDVAFEYGFNSKMLERVINYWRDDYLPRWRSREVYLSKFPHYTTNIQGLLIHFIHLKISEEKKINKTTYPILLLHGWPSSIREFYELIPMIESGNDDHPFVFDVIVPSIPGFAWSQGSTKQGFGPPEIAVILRNLMKSLGYEKFFIHGGDWGSLIGSHISTLFPENVIGFHANGCFLNSPMSYLKLLMASILPSIFIEKEHSSFFFPIIDQLSTLIEESGYFHLQATKPDTIGAVLTDNPIGLAAYILDRFVFLTNPEFKHLKDGGLENKYNLDTLLDNLMIYQITNSITTSQRLYYETFSNKQLNMILDRVPTNVPTGIVNFKFNPISVFKSQIKNKYENLVQVSYYSEGGHFAALEVPNVLYNDFIEFVKKAEQSVINK